MDGFDSPERVPMRHPDYCPVIVDVVRAPVLHFKRRIKATLREQIARGVDPATLRAVLEADADEVAGNFSEARRGPVRSMLLTVLDEVLSEPAEGG